VGDARPVERRVDLHVVAERMLDRLALEVLVRVAGIGEDVPDGERVERPARVDVRLAEVGVALGVRRGQSRKRDETDPPYSERHCPKVHPHPFTPRLSIAGAPNSPWRQGSPYTRRTGRSAR